jgi:ketosteroid isomerase-like protein
VDETENELLTLSQRFLDAIEQRDWEAYIEMCDPTLTAFEPEAVGNLITGLEFHRIYFDSSSRGMTVKSTISSPDVRLMGDVAVITYVRLRQRVDAQGVHSTSAHEETRIWQKQDRAWKHVHFHRSKSGTVEL